MKPRPLFCLVHHSRGPFRHGDIFNGAVGEHMAARDGDAVKAAVKFRQGYGDGSFHSIQAFRVGAPVFFRGQQGVSGQYRHPQLLQFVRCQAAIAHVGEFHGADQHIDGGFPVQRKEIGEHFTDGRHTQGFVRHLVGEHSHHVAALLFRFPDESGNVVQILPDPFFPVEQQTNHRSVRLVEFIQIGCQVVHAIVCHIGMVNARPASGPGFVRNRNLLVCQGRCVQPEVAEIFRTTVKSIPFQP